DGKSAKDMDRPAMQELIHKIKENKVATVATVAVDRLSRNLKDMLNFIEMCATHNTAYICTALDFNTSLPIGKMVLQILGAFAEFERSMIQTRVSETMLKAASNKKYMASPPFGYRLQEGKLIVVPEEADWVRKAADMFIAGQGYRAIAKWLNDCDVKTKKGVAWASSTVRGMLTNEVYIGTVVWNRRYYDAKGKLRWKDEEEWVTNEKVHEPILTEVQWNEINKRIKRKMPKGGERQYKYRLSGILKCGHCGSKMTSRRYGSHGPYKEKFIFVCSNYQKNGGCRFNYVFIDEADAIVYSLLDNITEGLLDLTMENLKNATEIQKLDFEKQERQIELKFQKQIEAYENDLISANDLKLARERVEREKALLLEQKKRAEEYAKQRKIVGQIQEETSQLLWLWRYGELPIIHHFLRAIFEAIVVEDREISSFLVSKELYCI
ncbi:MAG: recombinase family protein, partial [Bacteroidales bacterium]|nr:recombinase family protein [Bacteroidales bacterium]